MMLKLPFLLLFRDFWSEADQISAWWQAVGSEPHAKLRNCWQLIDAGGGKVVCHESVDSAKSGMLHRREPHAKE